MLEDGYEKICNIRKALDAKAKMKRAELGSQQASRSSLNCFRQKVEETDESQPMTIIENDGSSNQILSLSDEDD